MSDPANPVGRRGVMLAAPALLLLGAGRAEAQGQGGGDRPARPRPGGRPPLPARANILGEQLLAAQLAGRASAAISPLSLVDAMAPLVPGARGEALHSLGWLFGARGLAEATALHAALGTPGPLSRATAVWLPTGRPPAQAWRDAVAPLGTDVAQVDFAAPATLGTINAWVARRTNDRIPTLLERLPANPGLVITAALHFAARWAQPFDPAATRPAPFTRANGRRADAPFMQATRMLPHAETPRVHAVRLAYADAGFELTLLAPQADRGPREVVDLVRQRRALAALAAMRFAEAEVELAVPRFALGLGAELLGPLQASALGPAMKPEADYTRINGNALRIAQVRQQVVLRLDEAGTEAAAATAITGSRAMVERARFAADRPFLALVTHRASGLHVVAALVGEVEGS